MKKTLGEIAKLVNGEVYGDADIVITGVSDIEDSVQGDIVFAENAKFIEAAGKSPASAIITSKKVRDSGKPQISVDNPRYAFSQVLQAFSIRKSRCQGVHPSACIGENVVTGANLSIGYNAYIGDNVRIGDDVWIHPLSYVGNNVRMGDNVVIHPMAVITDDIIIGNNVSIHSGSVIGADGFGYVPVDGKHCKIPQIGTVVIHDDVEIGAGVTIDRARTGQTEIGKGVKIDNQVHIAHNVKIGENCIIIAQVGISGSVQIGDRVIMAGQSGFKNHVTVGDDALICARAGVVGDVRSGVCVSGFPARPHKDQMKIHAAQQKLPEMARLVRNLEKRVKELEAKLGE